MKLTGITPNLITDDINRALAFYAGVLGFRVVHRVPDEGPLVFAMLERDGVNVFLNDAKTAQAEVPDATGYVAGASGVAMFFQVEGVTAFWDAIRDRATVVMPLKDQWYGMTEFSISDPDGYLITFAERRASA
jgi:uncharacterized glyoxalase superfamily protein PhnB